MGALITAWTNYQSHLGPNGIVPLKSPGWGAMKTYCDNKGPPFAMERGGVYTWDGKAMKMVVNWNSGRRLAMTSIVPRRLQDPVTMALVAAVASNPEGFAKAAGTLGNDAVEIAGKIKTLISSTAAGTATVINLTDQDSCTWYTYNMGALITAWTNYQSHLGPNGIVPLKSPGWGAMKTYCDNKGPPFAMERGGVYTWDGKAMKMVVNWNQKRAALRRNTSFKIKENKRRLFDTAEIQKKVADAVLADPEKWSKLAGGAANGAVDLAAKIKGMVASATADSAMIINLSENDCTWYTYNQIALVKGWTPYQSHMGANSIVRVKSMGTGSMSTYCDNKGPSFQVDRGGVYEYDGKSLKLVVKSRRRRRLLNRN